jgi:putative transposase
MIDALKAIEAGPKTEEVARQYGVSHHTIYAWRAKYGGMELSEAQEVKQLREENARLKRLVFSCNRSRSMA